MEGRDKRGRDAEGGLDPSLWRKGRREREWVTSLSWRLCRRHLAPVRGARRRGPISICGTLTKWLWNRPHCDAPAERAPLRGLRVSARAPRKFSGADLAAPALSAVGTRKIQESAVRLSAHFAYCPSLDVCGTRPSAPAQLEELYKSGKLSKTVSPRKRSTSSVSWLCPESPQASRNWRTTDVPDPPMPFAL